MGLLTPDDGNDAFFFFHILAHVMTHMISSWSMDHVRWGQPPLGIKYTWGSPPFVFRTEEDSWMRGEIISQTSRSLVPFFSSSLD